MLKLTMKEWQRIIETIPQYVAYMESESIVSRAAHYVLLQDYLPCYMFNNQTCIDAWEKDNAKTF